MLDITFNNLNNLNVSLQVGDMIYATPTDLQSGSDDLEDTIGASLGVNRLVGILREIIELPNGGFRLTVDESGFSNPYTPSASDFIMFSKYSQTDGDVSGYYAKATFVNNSTEKAELFAVSSEIVINSK